MAENIFPQSGPQQLESQSDEGEPSNHLGKSPSKRKQLKHVDFTTLKRTKAPMAPRKSNVTHTQEDNDGNEKGANDQTREEVAEQMETQRMQLISPPPEEELNLRRVSSGRGGVQAHSNVESSMTLAHPTPIKATKHTKRKRAPASPMKYSTSASSGDDSMNGVGLLQPQPVSNATPNPKPRKQRHIRTQSVESPTRDSFETISPVPGSSSSKDRDVANPVSTTPTKPKRKVVLKSPHAKNLEADYIPPLVFNGDALQEGEPVNPARRAILSSRGSRRSATPIPAYEPPPDVFTPPREIYVNPAPPKSVSKSSKRKTPGHGGTKNVNRKGLKVNITGANIAVKQEIPDDLDLRAPMPPASPTDDPLLLSGPEIIVVLDDDEQVDISSTPIRERRRSVSVHTQTQVEDMHSLMKEEAMPPETTQHPMADDTLPPSSPEPPFDSEDAAAVTAFEWRQRPEQFAEDQTTDESMMQLDDPKDVEVEPIRLFDFDDSGGGGGWSDSDDDEHLNYAGDREEGEGEFTGKWTMSKIRTKEDPPSSATRTRQDLWGRPVSPFPKIRPLDFLKDCDNDDVEEDEVRRMSIEPEVLRDDQEEEEEERQVHEMSMELEEEINFPNVGYQTDHLVVEEPDVAQEEDDTDSDDDPGLVKIVSADPRAAARAVAILKQHDYDCFTKISKRRASYSTADDLAKHSRTRDVLDSGILKSSKKHRRSMGVVGNLVVIPDTPIMTLPELLLQAENEVFHDGAIVSPSSAFTERMRNPFKTPLTSRSTMAMSTLSTTPQQYPAGEREWTKDDWKLLDACFTDLRLEHGEPEDSLLADVGAIDLADVVLRFVELSGGRALVDSFGELWSSANLLERSRALETKQISGRVAPPTTPFSTRQQSEGNHKIVNQDHHLRSGLAVPDFTPLSRRIPHVLRPSRPALPPPTRGGIFANIPMESERVSKRVPASLLAPRYSHLLDEANDIAQDSFKSLQSSNFDPQPRSDSTGSGSVLSNEPVAESINVSASSAMSTRVKSFFTSYLPLLPRAQPVDRPRITQPGLPLPPKDILEKPRGPVTTPARLPTPRVPHPKDLVQLNHAPLPPSNIPRPRLAPKRLVELNHVSPPEAGDREDPVTQFLPPRPRRSSASSVKDLVQGFEKIGQASNINDFHSMQRTGSLNNVKAAWKQAQGDTRPKWKP
ncbi:hypothetical protein CPB83DRAFT_851507 [Crepidotus variabilis]|uniref:Uncharacterized protein n=1 Tax=Crepidotus variabilis TaxID=179855 RepID=A0A9P6JQU7_9AGAR|nr:hypothetical protein CPB83DRAFT_851507 [Crepidotus variabilis]